MKRLFILLTVCTLILAGCSGQSKQPITESQSVETTSQVEETETKTEVKAKASKIVTGAKYCLIHYI